MIPGTLILTANSPGEVAGLLRPVAAEARRRWPRTRLVVSLLPCTFATGAEERVARQIGIEEVLPVRAYPKLLLSGLRRYPSPALLHLGGDLLYSAFLSWRWGIPCWAYEWGRRWCDRAFRGYFVKGEEGLRRLQRRGIDPAKGRVVGDLVADAVAASLNGAAGGPDAPPVPRESLPCVSLLPGSRLRELRVTVPFLLAVAHRLAQAHPELRFQLLLSPFLDREKVRPVLESPPHPRMGGARGRLVKSPSGERLEAPDGTGLDLVWQNTLPALARSRLVVTGPGTRTAEAACLGVPMLVVLPGNVPEILPYVGLLGLLDWLPGGSRLKGRLLLRTADRTGPFAQPNILAGERLVPEIVRDVVTVDEVAERALEMLARPDELEATARRLRDLYRPYRGTARRILESIEAAP
jgi:hypothetical protein